MIISLDGKIAFKGLRYLVVEVDGVGYKVFVSPETLRKIPQNKEKIKIFTSLYVREDALELYGFLTMAEMELFETLNNVPGVGPKTALGVLGVGAIDMLKKAIAAGEASYLTKFQALAEKLQKK